MPPTSIATGDRRVALDIVRKTVHHPLVEILALCRREPGLPPAP
jgi:hypothetical protein